METKKGIYICTGCGISEAIDVEKLNESVAKGAAVCKNISACCTDECIGQIKADIEADGLNRLSVAACSGRYFTDLFDFGEEVVVDRLALRELVAWTAEPGEETTQETAEDYINMSLARLSNSEPLVPHIEETSKDVLVIGGGVAGMNAALASANAGYDVHLIEKEAELGGWSRKFKAAIPNVAPFKELRQPPHVELESQIRSNARVHLHTSTSIKQTIGQPGQFDVTLKNGKGDEVIRVGAIVQATGWKPYNSNKLADKYGYGKFKNVVTNVQLEEMASAGSIARPADGATPKSVAIIHCAGSRDKEHLAYCSGVCCRVAMKQALYIKEQLPDTNVYLLYKDIRSPGVYEQFYVNLQQHDGVFLTKGEVVEVTEQGSGELQIKLEDTLLGESIAIDAEMLVLATGMVPSTYVEGMEDAPGEEEVVAEPEDGEDGKKAAASAELGAKILNLKYRKGTDLPTLKYGFPDSHFICFPYETQRTGIYAAGCVRAPMDMSTAENDGLGAALKAIQAVEATARGVAVHPRSGDASFPDFFMQRCTQCKRCTEECPFGTLDEDDKGTPQPNPLRCRRCGICMGACPERIISFKNYSPNMVTQMIKSISMPEEFDEKPRILVFMCENDALPALDIAAFKRQKLSPWARIIPVRCIGSVNTVFIADALSSGFDGILLMGCQRGDDYQCHFIKGSELASKRMENVQEKLKQLVLEPERVRIDQVEISDWNRITNMINDFVEEIEDIGANPYKDF
ncbi:FAD-dependent oxidoreductase [Calditrichota bacterium]